MPGRRPRQAPSGEDADERLLVEAAQRDPQQFAALYERHFERVYAFAAARLRDRAAAEDVTAEVFHKALATLGTFEWRGAPFGAWLIRIAVNAIIDRGRQASRELSGRDPLVVAFDSADPPDLDAAEYHARLFRLVAGLPSDQRRVIVGRFVDERSISDIAGELGKSEGAVKQLQLRALQRLRRQLGGRDA